MQTLCFYLKYLGFCVPLMIDVLQTPIKGIKNCYRLIYIYTPPKQLIGLKY